MPIPLPGPTGRPWRARRGNTAPTRMPVHGRRVVPQTAVIPVVARRLYALAAELRHAVAERSQATNGPVSRRRCRSITATHLYVRGHEKVPTSGQVEVPVSGQLEVPVPRRVVSRVSGPVR